MDKKKVAKNVLTHPCLVAIYLGLICMVTQVKLPAVITATVKYLGGLQQRPHDADRGNDFGGCKNYNDL